MTASGIGPYPGIKEASLEIRAIPTDYRGRLYRSRLEARWAAFFDLLGWRYEYEPFDFRGWIPDFVIFGVEEILVEVKPYSELEEFDVEKIKAAMEKTEKWGREILLLGSAIQKSNTQLEPEDLGSDGKGPAIGWLGEFDYVGYFFDIAPLVRYSIPVENGESDRGSDQDYIGFCHGSGGYNDRITGRHAGGFVGGISWVDTLSLWNLAGNLVQWNPPKAGLERISDIAARALRTIGQKGEV